jgi:dTDP-4-dehydrorhamnose reductase
MKRLIIGKGKVSRIISKENDIILSRSECDISNIGEVRRAISEILPDVIINCAAKTNLEYCQENKLESFRSNTLGVINLLTVCQDFSIKLVHISSGCLFDGNEVISTENSSPSPAVWYTWTKSWSDEIIKNFGYNRFLILRPRQLISKTPHPSNMITKFSNMQKINAIQEDNSLTCIEDFSHMIDHLLKIDAKGIFNCCNTGTVTPYEIAVRIKDTIEPSLVVESTTYDSLLENLPNRRVNTILSCDKLIKTGYKPRSASEALDWCLKNYEN